MSNAPTDQATLGPAVVVPPEGGESYWQPVPANGYSQVKVSQRDDPRITGLSMGMQIIAPGCHIREHVHPDNDELLFFHAGHGRVGLNGVEHPVEAGSTVFVGQGNKHIIYNDGAEEMRMLWCVMPGSRMEDFFQAIGRPRAPGDPAPEPFARPENVTQIERDSVFGKLDEKR